MSVKIGLYWIFDRKGTHFPPNNQIFIAFITRIRSYLPAHPAVAELKKQIGVDGTATLLFSSRDREHNNAVVLAKVLSES